MKIKRFVAKDMRSALTQIKEELGADAVIMSNKKTPEGVELMAAVDYNQIVPVAKAQVALKPIEDNQLNNRSRVITDDVVSIASQATDHKLEQDAHNNPDFPTSRIEDTTQPAHTDSLSALLKRQVQQVAATPQIPNTPPVNSAEQTIEEQFKSFTERLNQSKSDDLIPALEDDTTADDITANVMPFGQSNIEQAQTDNETSVSQQDFAKMQQEMVSIRSLLEHQVSGLMWQDMAQKDPQRAVLVNRLLSLGLNEQIADQIAGYVPHQAKEPQAWQQATQLIAKQINTTQNDIIHRGGVVALVGPTGVGKTTTIAKLAAGFAQVHGSDQVALISTDTFRIAGFEQLATYGKIIGCQVMLAKDSQALDLLLQQFSKKKLILIDTAGMGQRDTRLAEQLASLVNNARVKIRNYLVLAANTQQRVMQENVERFKKVPIVGCIYTKLDESVSIGEIITTSIQNGLPIGYLTDGQRVPEDIKVANAEKLVTLADKMASKSVKDSNMPLRTMPVASAGVI
jgi:flagellar biosynthesis protein FlhF